MSLYTRVAQRSIPALDGIRALSVFLVILAHLGVEWASGVHGVMAFFVLSGFLITWLLLKENDQNGFISLRSFYVRRALRIFPAFYVFCVVYIVLVWIVQGKFPWAQYVACFFYVSNYYLPIVKPAHMAMAHTWSLAVEEQFYLLWPWLFCRFKDDLPKLTRVLSGFIVAVWIYRVVLYTQFYPGYDWLYTTFDCRADHLAIGCLTAVLIKRRFAAKTAGRITENTFAPAVTIAALAGSMYLRARWGERYQFLVGFMLDPVLLAVLMTQWIATSGAPAWRWLNSRPLRYLGRVSYSAYLYHWIVGNAILTRFGTWPMGVKILVVVTGSNLVAGASYVFIEKPFLKIKKRFEYARTAGAVS